MQHRENKEHNVALERERLKRLMEERAVIEEIMREDDNHLAVRAELEGTDRVKILKPIHVSSKESNYAANGKSYYDKWKTSSKTTYLGPRHDVSKMIESEQLVIRVMRQLDERKKLMETPIAELFKEVIKEDCPPNKYFAIRKMGEFLEEEEFTAEEIAMIRTLMKKIVNKNKGSKEELLLTLYVEEKL